jgi:hypothetical protein
VVSSRGHVHALRDHAGQLLNPPLLRNTSGSGHAIDAALHEDDAGLRFSMRDVWGDQAAV